MSASGPTISMCSIGSCAKRTRANLPLRGKEATNDQIRDAGRLWCADRACHVEDPAPFARSDRARLGVSYGERLRRQWLAAGEMEMKVGAPFEFVGRNDELTDPPGQRPPGFSEEHRMQSRITELDPPRKLAITWQGSGDVSFELEPKGNKVLLTII